MPTLIDLDREADGAPLTIGEVVKILGLSQNTVRDLVDANEIRSVRLGRNRKILWVSLREYLFRAKALPLTMAERRIAGHVHNRTS